MEFKIIKIPLYQWDLNKKINIIPPEGIEPDEVHFAHLRDKEALVAKARTKDGQLVADVPNILLQSNQPIKVWLVSNDQTVHGDILVVIAKAKPADYVYTETEILRYETLEKRIENLQEDVSKLSRDIADLKENAPTVEDVLNALPTWQGGAY